MTAITIEIPDSQLQKLQHLAKAQNVSLEELLCVGIDDWLSSSRSDFTKAASYVLQKNTELYKRLA